MPRPRARASSTNQLVPTYSAAPHFGSALCSMQAMVQLLLLAALPALTGHASWRAGGEVVSVVEAGGDAGGPAFAPRQHTVVLAAVGQQATLDCRVLRLGDKSVSWVRSRDLQILSHAGAVFTADARVSAAERRVSGSGSGSGGGGSSHALKIERLRVADGGRYECQVNTDPKLSLFFNLTVLDEPMPVVVVSAVEARVVRGAAGGAGSLACEARYSPAPRALPLPPLTLTWRRQGETNLIALQRSRGGVSLDTERWGQARVVSRLTLAELAASDAGVYECAAAGVSDNVTLTLDNEDAVEAMQRDESAASDAAAQPALPALLVLALASLIDR